MRLARPAAVAALTTAGLLLLAPVASAQAVVDSYSETEVLPQTLDRGTPGTDDTTTTRVVSARTAPATLPFTGGELVGVSAAGAALTAAGVALVVAGRRRQSA